MRTSEETLAALRSRPHYSVDDLLLIMQVLSLLFCLLQAVVFTMLLSIYISEGLEGEE